MSEQLETLLFDEMELKSFFSSDLLREGKKIFLSGKIQHFHKKNHQLSSHCISETDSTYTVSFTKQGQEKNGFCTCENKIDYCEHIAALCLYYLESVSAKKSRAFYKLNIENSEFQIMPKKELKQLDESVDLEALSKRLHTVINLNLDTQSYSIYFSDKQSNRFLGDSFYYLYAPEHIFSSLKDSLRELLMPLFYTHGITFFLPETFYPLNENTSFLTTLIENTPCITPKGVTIKTAKDPLDFNLRFSLETKGICLLAEWLCSKTKKRIPLHSGVLTKENQPQFITPTCHYKIKQQRHIQYANSFISDTKLYIDPNKFSDFMETKISKLKQKGISIFIEEGLNAINFINPPCQPLLQLKPYKDKVVGRLVFRYDSYSTKHTNNQSFIADKQHMKIILRDTDTENKIKSQLVPLSTQKNKKLLVFEGQNLCTLLSCLKDIPSLQVMGTSVFNIYSIHADTIVPKLEFTTHDNTEIHTLLSFEVDEAPVKEPSLFTHILNGDNYYKASDDTIYNISNLHPLKSLISTLNLSDKKDTYELNLALGQAVHFYKLYTENCITNQTIKSLITTLLNPTEFSPESTSLKKILHGYQKKGVEWLSKLYEHKLGGLLADDMGLGKTLQTITLIDALNQKKLLTKPVLILMPKSVLVNWHLEFKKFTPQLDPVIYDGRNRSQIRPTLKNTSIILVSYSILRQDINIFKDLEFSYIILDEAQTIKNASSKISKLVRSLKTENQLALSGTPIENNIREIWTLFEFLNPGYLPPLETFKKTIEKPIAAGDKQPLNDLSIKLSPFILRRLKKDVAPELPEKIEQTLHCPLNPQQDKLYKELLNSSIIDINNRIKSDGLEKSKFHIFSKLTKLRQVCCHPKLIDPESTAKSEKLDVLVERLQSIVASGHKVVIFSQFVSMLTHIESELITNNIGYKLLTGQTTNRQKHIDEFNSDPAFNVFLISLKAGGLGINLTAADYVFIYDPWWNPALEQQAMDRVHRLGQDKTVFVYKLISTNTIEEAIQTLQIKKQTLSDTLFKKESQLLSYLNTADLAQLLTTE